VKAALILTCGLCFVAVIAGFVALTIAGKDTAALVTVATSAAVYLIPQILTLLKAHRTQSDIAEVKERTNGPLTQMQYQVNQIATQLNEHLKDGNNAGSP